MIPIIEPLVIGISLYVMIVFIFLYIENEKKLFGKKRTTNWEPLISVIIPAYNEEENIAKCIESLLNADYPKEKLEIIVVDDGSKDKTAKIAEQYKDKGVKVIKKKNTGKADSLNVGIKQAKGEIIATLDADSYITKDAIRKMLPLFEEEGVVAVTATVLVDNKQNFWERIQEVEYIFTVFSRKILETIEAIHVTPGPFSMFRAWVFDKIGGFDPNNILEDQEIAMRIQKHNYKIRATTDAIVYTKVPDNFRDLLKQRTRWHRGGLRNSITYLDLISIKYGDLGLFVMPLQFISLLLLFLVMGIVIYSYISPSQSYPLEFSIFYGINPIILPALLTLLLTFIWVLIGAEKMNMEVKIEMAIIYVISYAYLITLYWISAIGKELFNKELTW